MVPTFQHATLRFARLFTHLHTNTCNLYTKTWLGAYTHTYVQSIHENTVWLRHADLTPFYFIRHTTLLKTDFPLHGLNCSYSSTFTYKYTFPHFTLLMFVVSDTFPHFTLLMFVVSDTFPHFTLLMFVVSDTWNVHAVH